MMNEIRILDIPELYSAYYRSGNLSKANEHANTVWESVKAAGGITIFNFDTEKDFPEGYGLAIIPLTMQIDYLTQTIGVCIAAIPEYNTLQKTDDGQMWIEDIVEKALVKKVLKYALLKAKYPRASDPPLMVKDFVGGAY